MSSKKCIKALHSYPTAPPVSEVSRSFPYNLRKHHTPSYGCTFPKCHRIFGVGSDWRHHENGEHFQEEAYLCQKISPSTLASCNELFYEIGMFKSHLESHHDIIDSEDIADEVQLQRIGRNRQVRFWCGFCEDLITLKEKRNAAWEEGFKHIDDHFQEGKAIEEWLCVEAKKKKGEILQEIDRGYFNEERTDILEGMNLSRSQHPQKREERQASAVPVANSRDARRVLILDDSNPDRLVTLGLDSSLKEDDDGKIESPIFNFYRKKLGSSWSPDSGLVSSIKRLSTVDMDDERGSPSRHENNQSPNEVSESIVQKNVAGKQELPFIGTDPLPSAESISRSTTSIVDSDLEEPQRIQNQIYSSPDENESAPEEDGAFDLFRANQICSQVTSRVAREIVESLLEQSPTGFIECPAGETPCGSASHSSGSNKPKSSPNESNSRKENNSTKRKRSGYQDSGGHEEGSDDGNNGNGPHEHRIWPRCKKRVERRLKCPFLWQEEQHATACKGIGFEDMSRVLTHVKKYHTRPRQCVRCWEEIESQKELEEHLRRNPVCEEVPEPKDGRKGFEKMRELNLRDKPLKDGKNDEEKWKLLFKDLFPEEHEVPSPCIRQALDE
ncbi:hypothetical protein K469DRAFT_280951 [Zopfia rhizophila CBS 207.26]|uniref:C2H2-type domain-containing protein n=1 Tax=Zopfia rhizophila CBS 207.26 TaxID=1314779 RepID=A0A6A6EST5_9PEZI|nr:hypothetical protein K469DRAFT_280951 [Zopfia rhizophila CBS 207.26]